MKEYMFEDDVLCAALELVMAQGGSADIDGVTLRVSWKAKGG
jgi:hypothetical protein